MTDPIKHFDSGAVRSSDADATAYSLITPIGLRRVAAAYAEGAAKYGDANWELGMPVREFIEHAVRHAYLYLAGDRSEDHLGHAAWNFMGACHSEELWPHLNADLRVEGCKLSEATQAEIKERNAARAATSLAPPPASQVAVENDGWKVGDKGYWVGSARGRYDFVVESIEPHTHAAGYPFSSVRLNFIDTRGGGSMGWMPSHQCHHVSS